MRFKVQDSLGVQGGLGFRVLGGLGFRVQGGLGFRVQCGLGFRVLGCMLSVFALGHGTSNSIPE